LTSASQIHGSRRYVEVVIISDVHLGTYGCHAKELAEYLHSIRPGMLILNGDIIDIWQFSKNYFPKPHLKVLKEIISLAAKGTPVHYITGNHDEMLRKFSGFELGKLSIENKLLLNIDGKKIWIFHGDVFDFTMQHAKWLTKLGAVGYDLLILLNASVNFILEKAGRNRISLSKKIKSSVKSAVKYINRFEEICADIAIRNKFDFVVCGHIHQPEIRHILTKSGRVTYMNSGDWVENLTALEYNEGNWTIYYHPIKSKGKKKERQEPESDASGMDSKALFQLLVHEINSTSTSTSK